MGIPRIDRLGALRIGLGFSLVLSIVAAQAQRTIHVPVDAASVQAGVDAASNGDTVLVSPGTWFENLDFHGKAITLSSAEGPATTILDGRRLAPVVAFTTGEGRASILSGFTIRNGAPPAASSAAVHGGGVVLHGASPTVRGNVFTGNLCAALDATDSAPLFTGNTVAATQAGALCAAQAIAPVTLTGDASGGLIAIVSGNTIEQNDLSSAVIQANAGGVALLDARATVQGNIIRHNNSGGSDAPGGIEVVANPTAPGTAPILIQQNLIYGNTSRCGAGGLSVAILGGSSSPSSPHVEAQVLNNTIVDNLTDPSCPAGSLPSEVTLGAASLPVQIVLANNIFAAASSHPALQCDATWTPDSFHHNLLHNIAGLFLSPGCVEPGTSLFADPAFEDRASSKYQLALSSPAVDSGSNAVAPMLSLDLGNSPRLQNATEKPSAIIDLGAYEHPAPHLVTGTTTILNATPANSEAYQAVTFSIQVTAASGIAPAGSVTLSAATGASPAARLATLALDASGRAAYTITSLTPSPWTLTAAYSGADALAPSTSAPILQTVQPATTILAFSLTPTDAGLAQPIRLAAHITAPLSTRLPPGAIQFFELLPAPAQPALLGVGALDPTGHASLTLPTMPMGTHRIAAAYPGTAEFAPVQLPAANALLLTVANADYTVAMAAPSLTLQTEHHGSVALTLTSVGSFGDTVTLTCANLPTPAACTFAPASVILTAGGNASATLSVETDAVANWASARPAGSFSNPSAIAFASLCPIGFFSLLALGSRRRRLPGILSAAVFALGTLVLTGCGAGRYPAHLAPGTYPVRIVSHAANTGIAHTVQITLIVTP